MEEVTSAIGITGTQTLATLKGTDIAGTISHHPMHGHGYDHEVPMLLADYVTTDQGTGFVHIAPGHGVEDYELAHLVLHLHIDRALLAARVDVVDAQRAELGQGQLGWVRAQVLGVVKEELPVHILRVALPALGLGEVLDRGDNIVSEGAVVHRPRLPDVAILRIVEDCQLRENICAGRRRSRLGLGGRPKQPVHKRRLGRGCAFRAGRRSH